MIVEYRGNGPYYDYSIVDNILTIAELDYNLNDLQTDSQTIVNVIVNNLFIANIIIPPAIYKQEVIDEVEAQVLQPVDTDRIKIILWAKQG